MPNGNDQKNAPFLWKNTNRKQTNSLLHRTNQFLRIKNIFQTGFSKETHETHATCHTHVKTFIIYELQRYHEKAIWPPTKFKSKINGTSSTYRKTNDEFSVTAGGLSSHSLIKTAWIIRTFNTSITLYCRRYLYRLPDFLCINISEHIKTHGSNEQQQLYSFTWFSSFT